MTEPISGTMITGGITAVAILVFLKEVYDEYRNPSPAKTTRSFAITPVAFLSGVVLLAGAADGPAGALFATIFFGTIYAIGVIYNDLFPGSTSH